MTTADQRIAGSLEAIEVLHLAFLQVLPTRLDQCGYILKGGTNLRYFYGSPRFSEDVDLDVVEVSKAKLEEQVDKVLSSRSLSFILRTQGLAIAETTKPKQTETTQRWKVKLVRSGATLQNGRTTIEFSRRGFDKRYQLDQIPPAIVAPYALRPPVVLRYLPPAMIELKIQALARRSETQARDVFDLDLLFRQHPELLKQGTLDARLIDIAVERVMELPFEAYRTQVVAFLAPDVIELYDSLAAWNQMQEHVAKALTKLR